MAALVTYMSAVYMRNHRVELKACYAIRASYCAFHHRTSFEVGDCRRPEYRFVGVVEVGYLFLRSIVRDLNGPIVSLGSTNWVELPVAQETA